MSDVLIASGLTKSFAQGAARIEVLDGAAVRLAAGERVALRGRSGAGKSTLLHILAGLENADSGSVRIGGEEMQQASSERRAQVRNRHLGFVYQMHHLLAEFSAVENVAMPLRIGGTGRRPATERAMALLEAVGLAARATHRPAELSGGERQRVAVARALVNDPGLVLADEPTGNLDRDSAEQVMGLISTLCQERGTAFLIATHDPNIAAQMDRTVTLSGGRLE